MDIDASLKTNRRRRGRARSVWLGGFFVLSAACALLIYLAAENPPAKREGDLASVPAYAADQITVLGLANARFWAWFETQGAALVHEWEQSRERERAVAGLVGSLPPAHYLAVSGGGGDGAFGAGLICGWGENGTQPPPQIVTGVQ